MNWKIETLFLLGFILSIGAPAFADDVTITVNGRVVAKPCTIVTKNANVELDKIYTQALKAPKSVSGWHSVNLQLTNCPEGTSSVIATLSGKSDGTGFYKNEGTANSVQIELQDESNTILNTGSTKTVKVDDTAKTANFPLKVRAISVLGGATQGSIESLINVTYTWQ